MFVKDLREKTGLSQSKFALKFHLNVSTLRTWEQGVRVCPEHVLYMMTRILELEGFLDGNTEIDN